jgi:hypothetical protein
VARVGAAALVNDHGVEVVDRVDRFLAVWCAAVLLIARTRHPRLEVETLRVWNDVSDFPAKVVAHEVDHEYAGCLLD